MKLIVYCHKRFAIRYCDNHKKCTDKRMRVVRYYYTVQKRLLMTSRCFFDDCDAGFDDTKEIYAYLDYTKTSLLGIRSIVEGAPR